MDKNHLIQLLIAASETIIRQRQEIATLKPQADAFKRIGQILDMNEPDSANAWGVDPVYHLQQAVDEMNAELADEGKVPPEPTYTTNEKTEFYRSPGRRAPAASVDLGGGQDLPRQDPSRDQALRGRVDVSVHRGLGLGPEDMAVD